MSWQISKVIRIQFRQLVHQLEQHLSSLIIECNDVADVDYFMQ